ncbi:hypothetical protein E8E13_002237 [Curvularia kusanoi]|uniref:Uncharacterized protein n=1 Tax=Curvularia kusanoi TaxID=90978 RepID=A0A9P4W6R2_CURKU|nr:hypothetical protein E8E13_002237 [Curvularia kusanoi]
METTSIGSPSTGDVTIVQNCLLLALPGELRNRIYELAVEDATAWQAKDFAEVSDNKERAKRLRDFRVLMAPHVRKNGSADIPWAALKRKYLGITQTCRQLRAESSEMFPKVWTRVDFIDLQDYMREIILVEAKDNASAVGCIEIAALRHASNSRIDIRDFLLLYKLRNRIYDIAISEEVGLEAEELPQLVHTQPSWITSFGRIEELEDLRRKSYGLTQTCRQIREEFLPIYRSNVKVRINIQDLQHYVADVIQGPSVDPMQAYGNIGIDVTGRCEVNLREVLLLNNCAPNFHLSLTRPEEADGAVMFLLSAGGSPKPELDAFIAEKTREVVLQVHRDPRCPAYRFGVDNDFSGSGPDSDSEFYPDSDDDSQPALCRLAYSDSSDDDAGDESQPVRYIPFQEMWSTCKLIVKEEFVEQWMRSRQRECNGTSQYEAELRLEDMLNFITLRGTVYETLLQQL